jgi:hypothetical protein
MDLSINEGTLVVTGGIGDSFQTAIAIKKTPKGLSAAGAEHLLLTQRYGARGVGWILAHQDSVVRDGRTYDIYRVMLAGGLEKRVFFDVTDWLASVQHHAPSAAGD